MQKDEIDDGIMVQDSNGSVKEVVATDPYAIGYVSLGMVDSRVTAVMIDDVRPTVENIIKKKYKIVRPFLYLHLGTPSERRSDVLWIMCFQKTVRKYCRKRG
ncbi:MAG: hypothetical protein MZU95_02965 [Desulfomicrobium escambiense]|nr:hypothetical protein [Desulfomicrobium escambiense]